MDEPSAYVPGSLERWSIPTIGPKFPHFALKNVKHSRYLPVSCHQGQSVNPNIKLAESVQLSWWKHFLVLQLVRACELLLRDRGSKILYDRYSKISYRIRFWSLS